MKVRYFVVFKQRRFNCSISSKHYILGHSFVTSESFRRIPCIIYVHVIVNSSSIG